MAHSAKRSGSRLPVAAVVSITAAITTALTASLVAGCGPSLPELTVQKTTLTVQETLYAQSTDTPFCDGLDMQQYEIVLSDITGLCSKLHMGLDNDSLFHHGTETNLRVVIPGDPSAINVTRTNTFKIGRYDCIPGDTLTPNDLVGVAHFSHQGAQAGAYTIDEVADSGTLSVTKLDAANGDMKGSYDLTFGDDHITGTFDATQCTSLTPAYAWK